MQETNNPAGYIEVAHDGPAVLIKIIKLGNMHDAVTMAEFVEDSLHNAYYKYAIDLKSCTGMDSTFMGTLAGLNCKVEDAGGHIFLINVSEDNKKLLKLIGVWEMLDVRENFELTAGLETTCLLPEDDPQKRLKHICAAHEKLVEVDARNKEKFGAFLGALKDENAESDEEPADKVVVEDSDAPMSSPSESQRSRNDIMKQAVKLMPTCDDDEIGIDDLDENEV